jgi:hypothetical protein
VLERRGPRCVYDRHFNRTCPPSAAHARSGIGCLALRATPCGNGGPPERLGAEDISLCEPEGLRHPHGDGIALQQRGVEHTARGRAQGFVAHSAAVASTPCDRGAAGVHQAIRADDEAYGYGGAHRGWAHRVAVSGAASEHRTLLNLGERVDASSRRAAEQSGSGIGTRGQCDRREQYCRSHIAPYGSATVDPDRAAWSGLRASGPARMRTPVCPWHRRVPARPSELLNRAATP